MQQILGRSTVAKKVVRKMNHCKLQENAFMSRDESTGSVVCPKPRRVGILANNVIRSFRLHSGQSESGAADVCGDSKAGADLLDIIRRKEETLSAVASPPPFFFGSPPSRAANPLAQDARFGDEKLNPVSPSLSPFLPTPSPSPSRVKGGGGCGRVNFGMKPAAVRVEGFDCQNSSIPAMA